MYGLIPPGYHTIRLRGGRDGVCANFGWKVTEPPQNSTVPSSRFPHLIQQQRARHHQLPHRTDQQRKRTPHRPIRARARKAPRHQTHQEQQPPIPRPVAAPQHPRIDEQVDVRRRGHGSSHVRDLQRPHHGHLRPAGDGQQRDDQLRERARGADAIPVLQRRGGEDEEGLEQRGGDEPPARAHAEEVAQLAEEGDAGDEEGEGDADVGEAEEVAGEAEDADGEEDGVAGLVGGEAAVVGEGGGVLHAGCEGEEVELGFEQGVVVDFVMEVGAAFGCSSVGACAGPRMLLEDSESCVFGQETHTP